MKLFKKAPAADGCAVFSVSAAVVAFALAAAFLCAGAWAQQSQGPVGKASDLTKLNLSRVAASAAQIRGVLETSPGLLVGLKRWLALDAAQHGQITRDEDLTDDAIYARLESDSQFRSVATTLLQKYGYLVPKLNPESDQARRQQLLDAERTKWIAQEEEQARAEAQQKEAADFAKKAACANRDPSCSSTLPNQGQQSNSTNRDQQQLGTVPLGVAPPDQDIPNYPLGNLPLPQPGALPPTRLVQLGGNSLDGEEGAESSALGPFGTSQGIGASGRNSNQFGFSLLSENQDGLGGETLDGGGGALGLGATQPNFGLNGGLGADASAIGGSGAGLGTGEFPGVSGAGQASAALTGSNGPSPLIPMQPLSKYPTIRPTQQPDLVRRLSPYSNVPSLVDMYVQTVAQPATPRRFGAEMFQNGTRDLELIPMDLPAGPDYVVGPGDGLSIDLFGGVSQRLIRTVDRSGQIELPEVGPVLVSGKTLSTLQQDLQQALRAQYRNISAGVSLSRLRTIRVYEVGDVANPGAYDISSLSTPLNALFVAGGPSQQGSLRILKHYRGGQLIQTVDVYDLLLHGVKSNLERLENGDTVQVPPIGPQVTVEGMVRRPAIYELRDEKTLASLLDLAGGILPAAALGHIEVERLVAHEKRTMLSVDISDHADAGKVEEELQAFSIQDGDRIRIYPIAPYNEEAIYVDGHVERPGRYSYKSGMRLTDIISSYKDMLPEPSQYAEIIRLSSPDFRPTVQSFSLTEALADPSKAPILQPMDTVRIFSRFDFEEAPSVSVLGEVRSPGEYRTSGQIHLIDAIHLAGGLSPDAQSGNAQVFRYMPDGKVEIFSVELAAALGGNPTENIILQPRDRLLIHPSANAVDPETVSVQGEVIKPGLYPLTTNLHVADLVRVAGGLKAAADAQSADLTTYSWSADNKLIGEHKAIDLSAALSGLDRSDLILKNGDVLTIKQLPGWNDLGASIVVKGEVKHPGTYGVRPGEKLSSILERVGGFQPDAYATGVILQRTQVRELEQKEQERMILRIKDTQSSLELLPDNTPQQKQAKETALQQWQTTLDQLSTNPPTGRVVIRISSDIKRWKNTTADIDVRAGDVLFIPKRPSVVMVAGQVFNPTAVSFRANKSANWYLGQAGGSTPLANKKAIFVVRADGSVLGAKIGVLSGDSLNSPLEPGDMVVVPDKAIGGGVQWQSVLLSAQVASSIASTVFIALRY